MLLILSTDIITLMLEYTNGRLLHVLLLLRLLDYTDILMSRQQLNQSAVRDSAAFQELNSKLQKITISAAAGSKSSDQLSQLLREENMLVKDHLNKAVEKGNEQLVKGAYQRRFLESLHFPEIHARQEEIADAHKETFHWVFEQAGPRLRPWDSFVKWLESGSRTYWISGKAGSGKSTLMSYVCQHPQTQRCLEFWSAGTTVVTPKFFFWNPGSSMQKSLQGLLRSLVYQILLENPDSITLITNLDDHSPDPFAPAHAWTERRLIRTLLDSVQHLVNRRCVCFFIDGLDEYSGDQSALVDLIEELATYPNVKCCLSSRPYRAFTDAFGSRAMLKLHDLTEPDIQAYVLDKFKTLYPAHPSVTSSPSSVSQLRNEIVERAEGVFLWVDLAVKDQIEGVRNGDSIGLLEERLRLLPKEITDLYARMLDRIGKIYQKEVATYLRVAVDLRSATLFDMVLAVHGLEISDSRSSPKPHFSKLMLEFKVTRSRINVIGGGLLEVHGQKEPISERTREDSEEEGEDRSCGYCEAYSKVTFSHRTAYEYFIETEKGRSFLGMSAPFNLRYQNKYLLQHKLMVEKLRVLGVPKCVHHQECFRLMIIDVMLLAARAETDTGRAEVSLMDNFDSLVAIVDRQYLRNPPDRHWSTRWGDPLCSPHDFLSLAAYHSVYLYVQHVLNNQKDPIDKRTADHLLYYIVFNQTANRGLVSRSPACKSQLELITSLLRRAANPNIPAFETTIWKEFLCQMFLRRMRFKDELLEDDTTPLWIESTKEFLLQGADVTKDISSYFYDSEVEGFVASSKWRYTGDFTLSPLSVLQLCLGSEPEYLDMEKTCLARGGLFHAASNELQFSSFIGSHTFEVYHLTEHQSERYCRDLQEYMQAPSAVAAEAHWEFGQRLDRLQKELHDYNQTKFFDLQRDEQEAKTLLRVQ